ncbi:MAG: hypothetical protein U5N56_00160 [Candidatus Marinimicrobia bacterium]|nr:hypothetical protein [Candidatus Neomarinimicrobiota bacterium]
MNQRETAKNNVLNAMARARLQEYLVIDGYTVPCKEGWVPGQILTHPSIGGEAGKRRKRELDEEGWIIESRRSATAPAMSTASFAPNTKDGVLS